MSSPSVDLSFPNFQLSSAYKILLICARRPGASQSHTLLEPPEEDGRLSASISFLTTCTSSAIIALIPSLTCTLTVAGSQLCGPQEQIARPDCLSTRISRGHSMIGATLQHTPARFQRAANRIASRSDPARISPAGSYPASLRNMTAKCGCFCASMMQRSGWKDDRTTGLFGTLCS